MFSDFLTVLLPSRQPALLMDFYQDTMRLPPVSDFWPGAGRQALFAAGKTGYIGVVPQSRELPCGPTALWVEASYVDEAYKALHQQGGAPILVDLMNTYYGAREFQVLDPDGNITCVINYEKDLPLRRQGAQGLYADEFRAVLYVKNLSACYQFYTGILGLPSVYQWEENRGDRGFKYQLCNNSNTYIETLFREPLAVQRQGVMALRANNLEECYQAVCARVPDAIALPLSAVFGQPGFGVWDPDGNLLVIWGPQEQ